MGGEEVCKRGQFQSTLPARGATIRGNFQKLARLISIHAPRTGSDERIYQHLTFTHGFQSTLPARGATSSTFADLLGSAHFNPRSPHGERRAGESRLRRADSISIHAPRTGSDRSGAGRTAVHLPISIHAPRTGSDRESPAHGAGLHYFNPRSPHGERHAPHQRRPSAFDFNPRSPHGERRRVAVARTAAHIFQSTLPARGATSAICFLPAGNLFQSTLPARERPGEPPPCGGA